MQCPHAWRIACFRSCVARWLCDKHYYDTHDRPRPFPCSQCNQAFLKRDHLDKHVMTHVRDDVLTHDDDGADVPSDAIAFSCRLCEQVFSSKNACLRHEMTHNSQWGAYSCSECGKDFLSKQSLARHEKSHRKPQRQPTAQVSAGAGGGSVTSLTRRSSAYAIGLMSVQRLHVC